MDGSRAEPLRPLPARWWAICVSGDLDLATGPQLDTRIARAVAQHPSDGLVLDLSAVTFVDCAGLRPLLRARNVLGQRLCLRAVPPLVLRLMVLADVARTLRILPAAQAWPAGADPGRCGILLDDLLEPRPLRPVLRLPVRHLADVPASDLADVPASDTVS